MSRLNREQMIAIGALLLLLLVCGASLAWSLQLRFDAARLSGVQPFKIHPAAGERVALDVLERRHLALVGGDGQFAAAAMPDTALGTIPVQKIAPGQAQPGLERSRLIMNAGMDDFAVARTGVHAELPFAFEDQHLAAAARHGPGHREADDAGADHDAIDIVQNLTRWTLSMPRPR